MDRTQRSAGTVDNGLFRQMLTTAGDRNDRSLPDAYDERLDSFHGQSIIKSPRY